MTSETLEIQTTAQGLSLEVKVVPGAARERIVGLLSGMLKVAVSAAPERGKANQALIQLLSEKLDVPKNGIRVVRGAQATHKTLLIRGLQPQELARKLGLNVQLKPGSANTERGN